MTFTEKLTLKLEQSGFSQKQIKDVMEYSKHYLSEIESEQGFKLSCQTDEYPQIIEKLVWMNFKPIVLKWIEINIPQAWFKPMFQ